LGIIAAAWQWLRRWSIAGVDAITAVTIMALMPEDSSRLATLPLDSD
jgi:hypothetical protein